MKTFQYISLLSIVLALTFSQCREWDELSTKPTITTPTVVGVASNTALINSNITQDGGADVYLRGVCWSTSQNPTTANYKTTDGTGTGNYTSQITKLTENTRYYVRAYASNSAGTAYSNQIELTTIQNQTLPTVTTHNISAVTEQSAICGGSVANDGGANVTARGVCWSTSQNPTTANSITTDGTGTGTFTSNITGLSANTTYYVRAYASNSEGTSYGEQRSFSTLTSSNDEIACDVFDNCNLSFFSGGDAQWFSQTNDVFYGASAAQSGEITDNQSSWIETSVEGAGVLQFHWKVSSEEGYDNLKFYVNNILTAQISGTEEWQEKTYTFSAGSTILRWVYEKDGYVSEGADAGWLDKLVFTQNTTEGDQTAVVDVTNPITGKTWMDRNLGATRAATSNTDTEAYGDLYQWGRADDGHQKRTSSTTGTLSSSDTPGHGNFITSGNSPYDWRSPQNDNLWQGVNGTNNPCPTGYRLPTAAEWEAERASWSSNDANGAFASPLKLPLAGYRNYGNGSFESVGTSGYYWTSSVNGLSVETIFISNTNAGIGPDSRAFGSSVRCIKD